MMESTRQEQADQTKKGLAFLIFLTCLGVTLILLAVEFGTYWFLFVFWLDTTLGNSPLDSVYRCGLMLGILMLLVFRSQANKLVKRLY